MFQFLGAVFSFQLCRGHDPWSRTASLPEPPHKLWLTLKTYPQNLPLKLYERRPFVLLLSNGTILAQCVKILFWQAIDYGEGGKTT